jgi:hypothetical protein
MNSNKIVPLFANFPLNGFASQGQEELRAGAKEGLDNRWREANHG